MNDVAVIILAAGKGKRTGQDTSKVLLKASDGRALLSWVLASASSLNPQQIVVVTGFGREHVEEECKDPKCITAFQKEQLGTGDAVRTGLDALPSFNGTLLVLYGDVPLISSQTLSDLITLHEEERNTISLLTLILQRNTDYGRIIRTSDGLVKKITEYKDCTLAERSLDEHNAGIYVFESAFLRPALKQLQPKNVQGELYLTDCIEMAFNEGQRVSALKSYNEEETLGVNTLSDLSKIDEILNRERIDTFIKDGVRFLDPKSVMISSTVKISKGAVIGPNVQLTGATSIAEGAVLEGSVYLKDVTVHSNARLKFGVYGEQCEIGEYSSVGPFANLRPGTVLKEKVKVGNFVEIKNTTMERDSKASHLTYLGDSHVGESANIGAGTITCNYDGYKKFRTSIGKEAFIGSNTSLVAPVEIGEGAVIGAGSVITKNVQGDALAVTRSVQKEIAGWAKAKREKNTGKP